MQAAARGDVTALQRLADGGADLARRHPSGMNLLHFAAQAQRGGDGVAAWLQANRPALFARLVAQRARPNQHSVALEAVFHGNAAMVDFLVKAAGGGAPVDFATPTVFGWTPRTFAERTQQPFAARVPAGSVQAAARARWLAEQDAAWMKGLAPVARARQTAGVQLLAAASAGAVDQVEALLAQGVDPNGRYGRLEATALNSIATPGMSTEAQRSARAVQRVLLAAGADPERAEGRVMRVAAGFREAVFGYPTLLTPLIAAMRARGPAALRRFLDAQGPMNGYTRLIDAALRGRAECIRVLVAAGADPRLTGYNGMTALDAANRYNASAETPLPPALLALLR